MWKRFLLALLAGLLLLAALTCVARLGKPRHHINPETIACIEEGMTERDVEELLGVPAGDYATRPVSGRFFEGSTPRGRGVMKKWQADEATIWVWFDEEAKVTATFVPIVYFREVEHFLTKLQRWLRL